jgi:hypothetical protein
MKLAEPNTLMRILYCQQKANHQTPFPPIVSPKRKAAATG